MADPVLVLDNTEDTSEEFHSNGLTLWIQMGSHAGGTWDLQAKDPDGNWNAVRRLDGQASTFTGDGVLPVEAAPPGAALRLSGGTVGARAWVYDNG